MLADRSGFLGRSALGTSRRALACLIVIAMGLGVAPARSETATVRGAGASTCGVYTQVYDGLHLAAGKATDGAVSADFLQYEEWIDGYILGMETSFKGRAAQRDWDQVDIGKWVSNYCEEHRSDIVANAALALFKEMRCAGL